MGLIEDIINYCTRDPGFLYAREESQYVETIAKAIDYSAEIGGADVQVTFNRAKREASAGHWDPAGELLRDAHRKAELVLKRAPFLTAKVEYEPKIKAAINIKPVNGKKYGEEVKIEWEDIKKIPGDNFEAAANRTLKLVERIDGEIKKALAGARQANKENLDKQKLELEQAKGDPGKLRDIAKEIFAITAEAENLGIDSGENARAPFAEGKVGENVWNVGNCEETFVAYDWFALKKCRKDKKIQLKGASLDFTDDDMWKLVQYRGKVVNEVIDDLRKKYPTLIAQATGSEDIESDIDIAFATPNSGDDVKAAKEFNQVIKSRFKKPPGRVFDVNIYPRDYRALRGDTFKPSYNVDENKDVGIDEPEQAESLKLSTIDQDVATLLKQRRFLEQDQFNEMLEDLLGKAPDEKTKNRIQKQYEEGEDLYLQTSLEKVAKIRGQVKLDDNSTDKHVMDLKKYLGDLDKIKGKGGKENLALAQELVPKILDLFEEGFPDETMDVTDALYLDKMESLRKDQESIRTLKQDGGPEKDHPGKKCEEVHKGEPHKAWASTKLNGLEVKVKKDMFTNIIFANEAIMSQGALNHVIGALQAKTPEAKKEAADKLSPSDLMQSVNEQVADLFKEMKHYEGVVEEAGETEGGKDKQEAAKKQATGEGYVHASKYFFRLLNAANLMNLKYPKEEFPQIHAPYAVVNNQPLDQLETKINDVLLKLRKSAVIPPEIKGEVGELEMQELFPNVKDIASFRTMISNFAIEVNKRIRSLDEFKKSQEMDAEKEREAEAGYFKTAAPEVAKEGTKEHAENQIRIILNKPLVANPDLAKHLETAGVKDSKTIAAKWTAAASALAKYKEEPDAAQETLNQFEAAVGKVEAGDVKEALLEAKDALAEKLEILKLACDNSGEFKTIESDFAAAEQESANPATYKALAEVQKNKRLDETQKSLLEEAQKRLQAVTKKLLTYNGKTLPEAVLRRKTLLTNSLKTRLEAVAKCLKM